MLLRTFDRRMELAKNLRSRLELVLEFHDLKKDQSIVCTGRDLFSHPVFTHKSTEHIYEYKKVFHLLIACFRVREQVDDSNAIETTCFPRYFLTSSCKILRK